MKKETNTPSHLRYITLGFQILATVLLGVLLGQWLDKKFNMDNDIYTISLSVLMIIVSMIQVVRTIIK